MLALAILLGATAAHAADACYMKTVTVTVTVRVDARLEAEATLQAGYPGELVDRAQRRRAGKAR